jgi:hypothetical protein
MHRPARFVVIATVPRLRSVFAPLIAIFAFLALPAHPMAAEPGDTSEAGASETSEAPPSGQGHPDVTGIARLGVGFPDFQGGILGASYGRLAVRTGAARGAYGLLTLTGKLGYRAPIVEGRGASGQGWEFAIPLLVSTRSSVNGDIEELTVGPEVEFDLRYWLSDDVGLNAALALGGGLWFDRGEVNASRPADSPAQPTGQLPLTLGPPIPTGNFQIGVVF